MALCTISEVHLSDCPGPLVKHCIVSEFDVRASWFLISSVLTLDQSLCQLEYGIGAERGWLFKLLNNTSENTEMFWENSE